MARAARPQPADAESFTSSDSQTMSATTSKKSTRKFPAPRKSKLKMPMVFGNMSQIFTSNSKEALTPNPSSVPKESLNRFVTNTDTNYVAARDRLKQILERRHFPKIVNPASQTQTLQQNANEEAGEIEQQINGASNKATNQSSSAAADTKSDVILPPPPQFS